jgi:hypothetical protein
MTLFLKTKKKFKLVTLQRNPGIHTVEVESEDTNLPSLLHITGLVSWITDVWTRGMAKVGGHSWPGPWGLPRRVYIVNGINGVVLSVQSIILEQARP